MSRAPVVIVATAAANGTEAPRATGASALCGVGRRGRDGGRRFTAVLARLVNSMPRGDPAVPLRPMLVVAPLQRGSIVIDGHILLAEKERVACAISNVGHAHRLPRHRAGVIPGRD